MAEGGAERRQHPRFGVQVRVWVKRHGATRSERATAINVSAGGMLLEMDDPPPAGARLSLGLVLGERRTPFRAEAEVMRHQVRDGVCLAGVRFVETTVSLRALIGRLASDLHTFGDFQIESLLGKGGMAEVYQASVRAGDHIFERVALKRIRQELLTSDHIRALFQAEGALAMKLHHPNIVETYEVGERAGIAYFVMELVEGCDLERLLFGCRLRKIALPIDFAAYVTHTVALALEYAHTACDEATGEPLGIVHRDVGPSNVFISDRGKIKVGDFGVAHIGDLPKKEKHVVVGKPSYQAPEQLKGAPPHPSMDVFAVGAVLFELLTGQRAFPLSNNRSRPAQLGPTPSARARRPEISPELEAVVQRALARDVEGAQGLWGRMNDRPTRFATAGAIASALAPCFDPAIGNELAIAAVVRGILGASVDSATAGGSEASGADAPGHDASTGPQQVKPEH